MTKYKIAFSCNWGDSPSQLLEKYKKQTPGSSGVWENIEGVSNLEEADYIISLPSCGDPHFLPSTIDKDKIIELRREPDFIQPWSSCGAKISVDYSSTEKYHVSTWQFLSVDYDKVINTEYNSKIKTEKCSTVCSPKWQHRNKFLYELALSTPYQIDMFGPPVMEKIFGKLYRPIHSRWKDTALEPYDYSIAMENSSQPNYFTEKINDCYLAWSMPIYWGCPNINEFFPEDSYKLLDIKDPQCIKEIMEQPIEDKHIKAMQEARDLIANKYNIWPTIKKLIN